MNAPVPKGAFLDPVKAAQAVVALLGNIEMSGYDLADQELVLDTIEGQTDFFEVLDAVLERMADDEVLVEGVGVVIGKLEDRRRRFKHRIEAARTLIEQAMTIAELTKLERPSATLSLSARAPSLKVTEESDIPADFWKPGTPTLDKKALTQALKERAKAMAELPEAPEEREAALATLPPEIPGATLSNGAPSITIRRA